MDKRIRTHYPQLVLPQGHKFRLSRQAAQLSFIFLVAPLLFALTAEGADKFAFPGWQKDSEYNGYYNPKEKDTLKGNVLNFKKITPIAGMAPATALILDEGGAEILVHICPWDYADPQKTAIRKGIKTKIIGSWANIEGQDVFMAAKIKQGDNFEYKVRLTKDGTPFWTLSAEELAKEASSSQD
jgi:hypothetical protein